MSGDRSGETGIMLQTLAALLLLAGPMSRATVPATVLVVSIDALHPDTLLGGTMPNVRRTMERGQFTLLGRSTKPPKTLIAHTAMVTGLPPERNGKTDNAWAEGWPTVKVRTVFHVAKDAGYRTAFFYSKEKLGYLVNPAVDAHALAPDDGVSRARRFFAKEAPAFVFLHVSGLEFVGMDSGWLSAEYLAEARSIDAALGPLIEEVTGRGNFLVVITSDHAGHGIEHGTDHPDDARLPLVLHSDGRRFPEVQDKPFEITGLVPILASVMAAGRLVDVPPARVDPGRSPARSPRRAPSRERPRD
jgi:predicted AlkP superfamily pyrophosphatase or phosphodiesterase